MTRWLLTLLLCLCLPALAANTHRVTITINAALVDAAIPVIPVYLSEGDSAFWTALQGGADIVVKDSAGNVLPHYLVPDLVDSGTTGTACVLVNAASIMSASVDQDIVIEIGDPALSDTSDGAAVFSGTGVRAAYIGGLTDVTGNGYDLTPVNAPTAVTGPFEGVGATEFVTASSQAAYHDSGVGTPVISDWPVTVEAWVNTARANTRDFLFGLSSDASDQPLASMESTWGGTAKFKGLYRGNSGSSSAPEYTAAVTDSTWINVITTRDAAAGTTNIYVDGAAGTSDNATLTAPSFNTIHMGALVRATTSFYASAKIGPAFIYDHVRSADEIATSINAWTNSGFLTWGATEEIPAEGGGVTDWVEFTAASGAGWANPTNALTSLATAATYDVPDGGTSGKLQTTDASAALAAVSGAINWVEIEVTGEAEASTGGSGGARTIEDFEIKLVVGGVLAGANKALSDIWSSSGETRTYTWDAAEIATLGLTDEQVTASDFGVSLQFEETDGNNNALMSVYRVRVRVSYGDVASSTASTDFFYLFD